MKSIVNVRIRLILISSRNIFLPSCRLLRKLIVAILVTLFVSAPFVGDTKLDEKYRKYQEKLAKQIYPIKKVKILIKMSGVSLKLASRVVKEGRISEANIILGRYVENVKQARQILYRSKQDARKKPAGFKHLEISLRKQLRELDDIKDHYPFDKQVSVDKTIKSVKDVKGEIMTTLFGSDNISRE